MSSHIMYVICFEIPMRGDTHRGIFVIVADTKQVVLQVNAESTPHTKPGCETRLRNYKVGRRCGEENYSQLPAFSLPAAATLLYVFIIHLLLLKEYYEENSFVSNFAYNISYADGAGAIHFFCRQKEE